MTEFIREIRVGNLYGMEVIYGINEPSVDPEETKKATIIELEKTREHTHLIAVQTRLQKLWAEFNELKQSKSKKDRQTKLNDLATLINAANEELKTATFEYHNKHKKLLSECIIYSQSRNSEFISEEDAKNIETKLRNLKQNEKLLRDGSIITEDEVNLKRISLLSDTKKQQEFEHQKNRMLRFAREKRQELEIQNDSEALEKSQSWYHEQIKELEKIYGVK